MGASALPARFAAAVNSHHQLTASPTLKPFAFTPRNSPHLLRPGRGSHKMGRGVSRGLLLSPAQHLCSSRAPDPFQFSSSLLGSLNVYLRLKGQTAIENPLWSSSGNKGQHWNQARVNINPPTSFQVTARAWRSGNGGVRVVEGRAVCAASFLLTQGFTASFRLRKALCGQIIAFLALNR